MLAVVNITVYVIPFLAQGPLQFAACGLDGIWEWGTLVRLDLRHLSAGAGGADFGPVPGAAGLTAFLSQYSGNFIAMLLKAVPLFVAVGSCWALASGSALHVPPSWDGYGPGCPGCGGGGRCSPAGFGT